MPKNKIEDMRNLLFETIERLMDDEDSMDLKRAQAVADVAQVIVNSAKVEVDFMKQTGHGGSSFIQAAANEPKRVGPLTEVPLIAGSTEFVPEEKLCIQCTLPDCNETSPQCLVQIQRKNFKQAA